MDLLPALKLATGVGTLLSFASFIAVLYFWWEARKKNESVRGLILSDNLTSRLSPRDLIKIVREFHTDEARLKALEQMTTLTREEARSVVSKIKSDIDPIMLESERSRALQQRLLLAFTGSIIISLASGVYTTYVATRSPVYAACRRSENGLEKWQKQAPWVAESGWLDGGNNQAQVCDSLLAAYQAAHPGTSIIISHTSEENKKDFFGHVQYKYHCIGTAFSDPLYKSEISPACGVAQ
jgi:hypothetical protein